MDLDPGICERARLSRDARFDGRFFTGVLTTGIFCRPICPAPPPKPENVRYFPSAAAASRAGLRPCLRCRPEASPGTPMWAGASDTVSRALAMIDSGALDDGSVDDLARCLGITSRHLSRLFRRHLGAPPIAVAQTHRLLFAKKLIDETDLPMAEVAFASGFGSVRRFNAVIRSVYGKRPTALRGDDHPGNVPETQRRPGDVLVLELPYRAPFDWDGLIDFLEPRAIPGVEDISRSCYRRSVAVSGNPGLLEVRPSLERPSLELRLRLASSKRLLSVVGRVRRLFDLGADPAETDTALARDPLLRARVLTRPGIRIPGAWDGFEVAVRTILGQQITVRGATTISGRLVERFGESFQIGDESTLRSLFPEPDALADAELEAIGIPRTRASAIRRLAAAVLDGAISFDPRGPIDETLERLTRLPGVGDWTAQYIAMRALGEPDAFPSSDLGLRKAAGLGGRPLTAAALRHRAEDWRPWRAYAAMHFWHELSHSGPCRIERARRSRRAS